MREERVTGFFDESLETMTAEERRDSLNRKLKDIVGYAYTHAAAFREKMDTSGLAPLDIQTVEDLEKLPIIRREDLVEAQTKIPPFGGFEAVSTGEMRRIYVSPGPVYEPGPWDYKDIGWAQALFAAGFRKNDIVQNTFNYHMWPFAFILDDSLKMIGCSVIPTGAGNSLIQLTIMKKLRTTGIVGTPSFLMSLAQRAESQGMTIKKDFSLEVGFVSAEMFPESLRTLLEKKLGINISQAYGTVTTGCIGYECPEKGGMHVCEDIIVEIVDPDTGKKMPAGATGEIVVTNFNKTYPMIRYATGDLSFFRQGGCACGRTSPKLGRILGRTDQVTKVKGTFIHPWQTDEIISKFPEIDKYQVVISRIGHLDKMTFKLELRDETVNKDILRAKIERLIKETLNVKGDVGFVVRGAIFDRHKKIDDQRKWD
jgi:phenylacetate-CoA ligase